MKRILLFFTLNLIFNLLFSIDINTKNITILRDKYGVPHIYGKTDEEVAYGLAWATAEDDFKSMQENFLTARSRLSEEMVPFWIFYAQF